MVHDTGGPGLVTSLRDALDRDESFSFFDLGLDDGVRAALRGLAVHEQAEYDNFGCPADLAGDLARFLREIGNTEEDAASCAPHLSRLAEAMRCGFGAEAAWVTVRAALPGTDYDVPRWHGDGRFYEDSGGTQRKAAAVLKGPQTLLCDLPPERRAAFNALASTLWQQTPENRRKIADFISESQTITQTAREGEGIVFVVGSERRGIHSEPPIHEPRLFLSVVPGRADQIEELCQRWDRPPTTYRPG